jgi:hypothetical protein
MFLGMSQHDAIKQIPGLRAHSTLCRIENGQGVEINTAVAVCAWLQLPMDSFVRRADVGMLKVRRARKGTRPDGGLLGGAAVPADDCAIEVREVGLDPGGYLGDASPDGVAAGGGADSPQAGGDEGPQGGTEGRDSGSECGGLTEPVGFGEGRTGEGAEGVQ